MYTSETPFLTALLIVAWQKKARGKTGKARDTNGELAERRWQFCLADKREMRTESDIFFGRGPHRSVLLCLLSDLPRSFRIAAGKQMRNDIDNWFDNRSPPFFLYFPSSKRGIPIFVTRHIGIERRQIVNFNVEVALFKPRLAISLEPGYLRIRLLLS